MAADAGFVSKEQPSIADDPGLVNAFYDAPTVITLFAPKDFLFSTDDCAPAADVSGAGSCHIGQGWTAFADPCGQEILRKWEIRAGYYAVMQLLPGDPGPGAPTRRGRPGKMTGF